jgi:hypothetical protein
MPPGPGAYSHQLLLDDISGNFDASQGYLITNWQQTGINQQFSQGLYNPDASFKITRSGALTATAQSDGVTMTRFNQIGIVDFPNQSRVRAFQEAAPVTYQLIPPGQWTPVNFTIDLQPPYGYDEHNEFTVATINAVVPPEQAYFTAAEAGYYQVNARCEFNVDEYFEDDLGEALPVQVTPDSYVSIAIYTGIAPGATSIYAQGNKLQIGNMIMYEHAMLVHMPGGPDEYMLEYMMIEEISKLRNNNAPNVSDVIYLQAGEIISIWVYHTAATPMNLDYIDHTNGMVSGKSKIYVSIHKSS